MLVTNSPSFFVCQNFLSCLSALKMSQLSPMVVGKTPTVTYTKSHSLLILYNFLPAFFTFWLSCRTWEPQQRVKTNSKLTALSKNKQSISPLASLCYINIKGGVMCIIKAAAWKWWCPTFDFCRTKRQQWILSQVSQILLIERFVR